MTALIVILVAACLVAAPAASAAPVVPAERALYADGPSGRYLLDAGWEQRAVGQPRWRAVRVPNAFNARDLTARGFRGGVHWYRTRFVAPPRTPRTTGWALRFEAVNRHATVWLNGRRLGAHEGAYVPFELRADGLRAGVNELRVRVDGRLSPRSLPPSTRPRGWWNWAGILREVYLRRLTGLDVTALSVASPAAVSATVRNTAASPVAMTWQLEVTGPGGFAASASGDAGVVPAGAEVPVSATVEIADPQLWAPGRPALYEARLTVSGGQARVSHFGIRTWSVQGGRALLNGAPVDLRGASFHEETAAHGGALTVADRAEIVRELTWLGVDVTRAHYPPHPALLEAFDRLGIVFWEQIPVWRLMGSDLRGGLRREALSLLAQTVQRDRGHASVMAWSVENEIQRGDADERRYLAEAAALVRALDPTRLVAADGSLSPLPALSPALGGLGAIGLNEYVGWYGGSLPGGLRSLLGSAGRRYPAPALFITEFGAEANRSGPASVKGTYAFQRRFLDRTLDVLDADPRLSGALVWALRDFAVRPGWEGGNPRPSPPLNAKGLFRRDGRPKPAAFSVRERFRSGPGEVAGP